jgi:hypothetical protein
MIQTRHNARVRRSSQPQRCSGPCPARNLHREAQELIKQAAVQQAESSASRIRQQGSAQDDGGAQGQEASVHAGGAAGQLANQGRTPARERILDTRG